MAVMLPFEEALWRDAGAEARYVGHPALEAKPLERGAARRAMGMTSLAPAVAILPGSRPHEVRRLLVSMLEAYERVRHHRASLDARVLIASSLDESTRRWAHARCDAARVTTFDVDARRGAARVLRAFDASLCASGTATLDAALARAVPVVVYRTGFATELAARALVRTPHVALPNVLLGRRAFVELLQREARPDRMAVAVEEALERRSTWVEACDGVEAALGTARAPSLEVARILAPWLDARLASRDRAA
jgi:lipid-A-disaccharide synthase